MRHPNQNTILHGQTRARTFLTNTFVHNTLPHAFIFSGPKGIGKATCAYHLACSIFNNDVHMLQEKSVDNMINKRMIAGTHGDLFVLENTPTDDKVKKNIISVDQVRQLIAFTNKTAMEGGWRIIIIDSLDEMNHQSLNALLKRLEEPPARCLFILIHHYQKSIPATILSRCQRVLFQPLQQSDFTLVLDDQNIALSQPNIDIIYKMAEGSVLRAWRLIKFNGSQINDQLQDLLVDLTNNNWQPCLTFIHNFLSPSKEYVLGDKLSLLGDLLCFNLVQALQPHQLNSLSSQFRAVLQNYPPDRICDIWQKIQILYRDVEYLNLDPYQVVVSSFNMIYQLLNTSLNQQDTFTNPCLNSGD